MKTVIKRSPTNQTIQRFTDEVLAALDREISCRPEVQDGAADEFSIYVDDNPVMERDAQHMPTIEEVFIGLERATPTIA